jgi:hypothetical protein
MTWSNPSFLLLAGLSLDSNIFHTFITEEEGYMIYSASESA